MSESKTTALIVEWVKHSHIDWQDDEGKDICSADEEMEIRDQLIEMIDVAQEMKKNIGEFLQAEQRWLDCGCGTPEALFLDEMRKKMMADIVKATKAGIE